MTPTHPTNTGRPRGAAGIDGCRAGWLCVAEIENSLQSFICADISRVVQQLPADTLIGIDVPIGLPDTDSRRCDLEARKLLGRRGVSVFPAPLRWTIEHMANDTSYARVHAEQRRHHARGKGLSQQAWRLLPKIHEIDSFLREDPSRAERIVEVHPEVSFHFWNGEAPLPGSKKSREGTVARARLIDASWPGERERLLHELRAAHRGEFAEDDLCDAFAALWSMRRHRSRTAITLPSRVNRDSVGLPQQIVA
jgi:predicted RNase H-like nuclease